MKKLIAVAIVVLALGLTGCTETKWEYKIDSISDGTFKDQMEKIGEDGWELVFARRALSDGRGIYEMIFKRPKK